MSRRVYLLGVGIVLVALALAFTDRALSLRPGVTEANVQRIRPGMTLADVEALLGGPGKFLGKEHPRAARVLYVWQTGSAGASALISFDLSGRADCALFLRGEEPSPGPFARLRAWLGW